MYGKTANALQFVTRTGIHSTKGSRRGFLDVNTGVSPIEDITTLQVRDNLLRAREAASAIALDPGRPKKERNEARQRVYSMSLKLDKLRKKIRRDGLPEHFMEQARAALPADVYRDLAERAKLEWDLANKWATEADDD